ncbi:LysR family transcriptional regulator [cf. Phormidesmis sp. LEGE 11477]|uniref:LysR family transcriptional regulator n=1 Tax=cf. Phormidesmis sp. LEGE 11477 TaxID=1828680 RepID=UPI00187F6022|nr:LysR family transcriptional regulator [cf. Phormidesmis sp. LEGE 11477]MBE9060708.1 LysR family transcriptional regulator [cf. Phormidesmis sp. LEGE 11477]
MKSNAQNRIKLSQLQILVAVAEYENFSEAALSLGISQSAVSHAIASLEDYLGIVLFNRGRHGATLTAVGDRILKHAKTITSSTDAILQEATAAKGLEKGQVRIASFRSVSTHILPRAIKALHQKRPGITLSLTEHDSNKAVEQALKEGRADIGIVLMPAGKGLTAWELLQDEFVVLLPPDAKLESNSLTWSELSKQPLIMSPVDYPAMRPVYEHINALGYWLNVVNEVETDAAIVSLVEQGIGGTILPRLAAEPIPATVQVFSLPEPLMRVIGVAIATETLQPPPVYALLEMLKDVAVSS